MKRTLLFLFVLLGFAFMNACGDDGDDPIIDDEKNINTFKPPTDAAGVAKFLGGDGKDSVVWIGQKWTQAAWDPFTLAFSPNEEDITDNQDVQFKKHTIWFKHDSYQSDRLGYPVGKGRWTDPMGKTGLTYELKVDVIDKIFVNTQEKYPPSGGRQDWENLKITENSIEYTRVWNYGSKKIQDRFLWTRK